MPKENKNQNPEEEKSGRDPFAPDFVPEKPPIEAENIKVEEPKERRESPPSRTSPQKLLIGITKVGAALVGTFYLILLWGLLSGNANNPIFETLGIGPTDLKDVLLTTTNTLFGVGALVSLIAVLIPLFQWLVTKKAAPNRKDYLVRSGILGGIFIGILALWVFFFWLITNADARGRQKLDDSMVITNPGIVIGLTAPITVEFDIGTRLFQQIDQTLVRQINWDFNGDNATDASGPRVTHRFISRGNNNGRFPVSVEVYYYSPGEDKEKIFQSTREVIISNESVIPAFTATPEAGIPPLEVKFDATESRDPDGEVILYEWDFDNNGDFEVRGEQPTAQHIFTQPGEQIVTLQTTGTNNDTETVERTINVRNPEQNLKAEINSVEGFEGVAPFRLTLDGSQSFVREGKITRYEWFVEGEEKPVLGRRIQRVFRKPGTYEITLTIENDLAQRHKATQIVTVLEDASSGEVAIRTTPVTPKGKPLRGTVPFSVTFDSGQSDVNNALEWQWDFENDGIVDGYTPAVQHIFRKPGVYTVKLVIIDNAENQYQQTLQVVAKRSGTQAKIVANPPSGSVPLEITFDGSGSFTDSGEIINYVWEFGNNGPINYGAKISYLFRRVGIYPVRLTILTSTGETGTKEILVSARAQTVGAEFDYTPTTGDAPLEVQFSAIESTGTIAEYRWNFGDNGTTRGINPKHTFLEKGEYKVTLQVVDRNGVTAEIIKTIKVK